MKRSLILIALAWMLCGCGGLSSVLNPCHKGTPDGLTDCNGTLWPNGGN